MELAPEKCCNHSGYLQKKGTKMMAGWQKRFFRIIEGKMIIYSDLHTDKQIKGYMMIQDISKADSVDKRTLTYTVDGREYLLKAEDEEGKNDWITAINYSINRLLIKKKDSVKKTDYNSKEENEERIYARDNKEDKEFNKINTIEKKYIELLANHGFAINEDAVVSLKFLNELKISTILNLTNPDIKARIRHGFLNIKYHTMDYQKRWFFICSTRPLYDQHYEKDDKTIVNKLKGWLQYDTLFMFKFEKEDITPQPIDTIPMNQVHELKPQDDKKYEIFMDVGDSKSSLHCNIKGERDLWYEVLRNGHKTAKEISNSVTKAPRNVYRLMNILSEHGQPKLIAELDKEKEKVIGDYKQIKDIETLDFILMNLEKEICSTLDGCISLQEKPALELLEVYSEHLHAAYLAVVQTYWSSNHGEMTNSDILKLGDLLFTYATNLAQYRLNDNNFTKNAKEFVKIFIKKTFKEVSEMIKNILKSERETQQITSANDLLITNGPNDLFDLLTKSFDNIKIYKHKFIHSQMFTMFHECIIDYLIGVDCVISNDRILISKEFLLAIANNSIIILEKTTRLIDDCERLEVLPKEDITEALNFKAIMASINLMSQNSVSRFVSDFASKLSDTFDSSYMRLNIQNVLTSTQDIFSSYNPFMNIMSKKKFYEEILKLTVFFYVKLLLTTAHNDVKEVSQLTDRLKYDKEVMTETYENVVGVNLTEATLRILTDIHDFLEVSSFMIPSSCLSLREYIGPSLSINTIKALITLRCDFSREEKNEAIDNCKEVLESYKDTVKMKGGFFEKMEQAIQIENEEEPTETPQELEEKKKEEETKEFNLDDFLGGDGDGEGEGGAGNEGGEGEGEEDKEPEEEEEDDDEEVITEDVEEVAISDIIHEGTMKKKSSTKWQERFFQIKNGYLYWFKNKDSTEIQKKISLAKALSLKPTKERKFMLTVESNDKEKEGDTGKVYKFQCEDHADKEEWLKILTSEMKRLKGETEKKKTCLYDIKAKPKVIDDYFGYPAVGKDRSMFKNRVIEAMSQETYFKIKEIVIEKPPPKVVKEKPTKATVKEEKPVKEKKGFDFGTLFQKNNDDKDKDDKDKKKFTLGGIFKKKEKDPNKVEEPKEKKKFTIGNIFNDDKPKDKEEPKEKKKFEFKNPFKK